MLQILPKWKVIIHTDNDFVFYMYANFSSNVLNKVAELYFEKPVIQIIISQVVDAPMNNTGVITSI